MHIFLLTKFLFETTQFFVWDEVDQGKLVAGTGADAFVGVDFLATPIARAKSAKSKRLCFIFSPCEVFV